jgi:hypothetical protein
MTFCSIEIDGKKRMSFCLYIYAFFFSLKLKTYSPLNVSFVTDYFYYFGKDAIEIPENFLEIISKL